MHENDDLGGCSPPHADPKPICTAAYHAWWKKGERCVRVSFPPVLLRNLSDYFIPSRPVSWRYQWVCLFILPSNWLFRPLLAAHPVRCQQSSQACTRNLPAACSGWLVVLGGGVARICRPLMRGAAGGEPLNQGLPVTSSLCGAVRYLSASLFFNDTCLMVSSPAVPHLLGPRHVLLPVLPQLWRASKTHLLVCAVDIDMVACPPRPCPPSPDTLQPNPRSV